MTLLLVIFFLSSYHQSGSPKIISVITISHARSQLEMSRVSLSPTAALHPTQIVSRMHGIVEKLSTKRAINFPLQLPQEGIAVPVCLISRGSNPAVRRDRRKFPHIIYVNEEGVRGIFLVFGHHNNDTYVSVKFTAKTSHIRIAATGSV